MGCVQFPPHGYSEAPPTSIVDLIESGCKHQAIWPATHSTEEDRFAYCMARLGLYRGRSRALTLWSAPSPTGRWSDLAECTEEAQRKQERFDRCMAGAGFSFVSGSFRVPYHRDDTSLNETRSQLKLCHAEVPTDRFEMEVSRCLTDRGWRWKRIDSRGRAV